MLDFVETKNFEQVVEDVDEKGVVTIYVNAFGNKDSDGDISSEKAFDRTIKENFNRIKHFVNHDGRLLAGIPLEMTPDQVGLKVRSKLNLEKELGRDIYSDYKLYKENGRTLEHSIGFNIVSRDQKNKDIITEYKLWEYSTLTNWGANSQTPLVDLKSFKSPEDVILKIKELTEMYNRAYSDGRLVSIENALKALEKAGPVAETTPNDKPLDDARIELVKQLRKSFQVN